MKENIVDFLRHSLPTRALASTVRRRKSASSPPHILVTRLDGIGDLILLGPFLRELRRHFRESKITLVVGRNAAPLARRCPYVNTVLEVDLAPKRGSFSSYGQYAAATVRHFLEISKFAKEHLAGIDLAIHPRWDTDRDLATLITVLSAAPRTVGYSERASAVKSWANRGFGRLMTDVLSAGPEQHEVERNLDIVRYLGGFVENSKLEIWWNAEDESHAGRFLAEAGISGDIIAFGIGAAKEWCRWPFYPELIRLLKKRREFTPLLLAGRGEEQLAQGIADASGAVVMQGLPLSVVAAVLSRCTTYVGNNSGPLHLASAVGLPVIEICAHPLTGPRWHEGHPERFGSRADRRAVIRPADFSEGCKDGCSATLPHCIASITPEQVAVEVWRLSDPGRRESRVRPMQGC